MSFYCPKDKKVVTLCKKKECSHWIALPKYSNCELVAAQHAPLTLRDIAQALGILVEGVRQVEMRILNKLRRVLGDPYPKGQYNEGVDCERDM